MAAAQLQAIHLKDYQPSDFVIDHAYLHFDIHDNETRVITVINCRRNPESQNKKAPLVLDGEKMELKRVLVDAKALSEKQYKVGEVSLTIFDVPNEFTLEIEVVIKPKENKALCGLYQSRHNLCTQCESHGFRRIIYFLDRPDVMTRFTTTITADKKKFPALLSNGNLIEERELSGGRHWVKWEDPSKKPSYLFALVAGDFDLLTDTFTTMSGRVVDIRLYLEKGYADQGSFAIDALKKAMKWDEETYGREYDLDIYMIVAVSDFNMGAMENKGLNVFNTKYVLARPETATDHDYIGIEQVIGHEYFHNWTGNRITCRDWFQLTLKEGLTVFRDATFTEDMTSYGPTRLGEVAVVRTKQFAEDAGPMAHPIRPESYIEMNNFYTATVYRKGAEVIRMIRTLIGKDNFRKAMDLYFERHDGQAVTTDDFVQCMQDVSGEDLIQFKRWYAQAGTPVLKIISEYDEKAKTFTLHVNQSCPATPGQKTKEPLHIPLSIGLISSECKDIYDETIVLEVTEEEQSFIFEEIAERPIPSLLRDFSAPVKVVYPYTDEELLWLLQCDSDPFARWEAGQIYLTRLILKLATEFRSGTPMEMPSILCDAFAKLLEGQHQDKRMQACLLHLPSMNYLVQQTENADVEALFSARLFIRSELAIQLVDLWQKNYDANQLDSYEYDMEHVGIRSLKNCCLHYLAATNDQKYFELAYRQFKSSDNMTDAMGALQALNDFDCPERHKALDEFYAKWKDQPLVVNKWLALHSMSQREDTLGQVKQCLSHEGFDIKNPNNVYSLLGAFADNVGRFHDSSGEAYDFFADKVIEIDGFNPQVSARIVLPLTQWKQYADEHQVKMRRALEKMASKKLSKDLYEVVSKSL